MKLHTTDLLIICAYLIAMIVIGLILKKRAAQNMDSYFLGGKSLPFYMLGLSNASGMFDITGTMLMVYWAFAYGFKSLWIPWLWPVFNQIFLMVYLSVWLRRSNVLTGAEWIKTRFGKGKGSTLSHTIVIVFALLSVLGFLSYGFIGIGKFMEIFIPWEVVSPFIPFNVPAEYVPHVYGIFFTTIATFYVMLGGMLSMGYEVYTGNAKGKEIDFVAQKTGETIYIQCSYIMSDQSTIKREFSPLETINDNFPKVVVSIDDMVLPSHNGIKHIQAWHLRNELIYHKE